MNNKNYLVIAIGLSMLISTSQTLCNSTAVQLYDGDQAAAVTWLKSPCRALGGEVPLDFAKSELGAHEVENVIGRLEHGVFQ